MLMGVEAEVEGWEYEEEGEEGVVRHEEVVWVSSSSSELRLPSSSTETDTTEINMHTHTHTIKHAGAPTKNTNMD